MTKESAVKYLMRIEEDEKLKKNVINASSGRARKAILKTAGFCFTQDELKEVFKEEIVKGFKNRRKLSDTELAKITGGSDR